MSRFKAHFERHASGRLGWLRAAVRCHGPERRPILVAELKENIQMPMREHLHLSDVLLEDMAMLKLDLVGLPADAASKSPAELSGGVTKRAALARALAFDPDTMFLDEPTSGLDPIGAGEFDVLIAGLRKTLNMTVFMVA